jgi:hypothetical protein
METTFMTDVPAPAATMICLGSGIATLDRAGRSRWKWLIVSMAAGIFGFSIRQVVVAAPIAVLVAALAKFRHDWKILLGLALAMIAACLGILAWIHGIPGPRQASYWMPNWSTEVSVVKLLGADAAFALLPASLLVIITSSRTRVAVLSIILLIATVAILVVSHANSGSPLLGDIFSQWGSASALVALGTRPLLFPGALWTTLEWTSWAALACAVVALLSRRPAPYTRPTLNHIRSRLAHPIRLTPIRNWFGEPQGLLTIFILGSSALVALTSWAGVWDRYCWPILGPLAVLILLRGQSSPRNSTAARIGMALFALVMLGVVLVQFAVSNNSAAFDAARWHGATDLTRIGVTPRTIDAGIEWVGYHQPGPVVLSTPPGSTPYIWYQLLFSYPPICGIVASSPTTFAGFSPEGSISYRLLAITGPVDHVYLYKSQQPIACATRAG